MATISSADPGARRAISRALDEADKNPRPERAKKSLLLAIGAVGDKSALPTVAKRLSDGDDEVRGAAARAMGRLGPSASDYVPQLATVFKEGKPQTRIHVAVALGSIGGKEAMQVMERALEEKGLSPSLERTLKYALRNAQGRMGSK